MSTSAHFIGQSHTLKSDLAALRRRTSSCKPQPSCSVQGSLLPGSTCRISKTTAIKLGAMTATTICAKIDGIVHRRQQAQAQRSRSNVSRSTLSKRTFSSSTLRRSTPRRTHLRARARAKAKAKVGAKVSMDTKVPAPVASGPLLLCRPFPSSQCITKLT